MILLTLVACSGAPGPTETDLARVDCPTGQAAGADGICVPEACVALPEGDVYVAEGGAGDGSAAAPLGSLEEAVARGGTVVVGPGRWPGLNLDAEADGLVLVGRCVGEVVIEGAPAVHLDGGRDGQVSLLDLTLSGEGGLVVESGALDATGVEVVDAEGVGVSVSGSNSRVVLTDSLVSGTQVVDRAGGNGAVVEGGGELVATRVLFDANHDIGVSFAGRGSAGTLTDVTISNTAEARDGQDGWGLYVADGADVVATGLLLSGNSTVSLVAGQSGTSLTLTDSVIEHTLAGDNEAVGYGAQLGFGGMLTVSRTEIRDSVGIGLVLSGSSTVSLEDVTVRGVRGPDGVSLDCVYAEGGVELVGEGLDLGDCGTLGVGAEEAGTVVRIHNSRIQAPRAVAGDFGAAVYLEQGAHAELVGLETDTTGALAISVGASTATLEDVHLAGGRGIFGYFGWGVEVVDGGEVDATGLTLDGMREAGVVVSGPTSAARLDDLVLTGTVRSSGMETAVGLVAQDGGSATLTNLEATHNAGPALLAMDGTVAVEGGRITGSSFAGAVMLGGHLSLTDVSISDVDPDPGLGGGVGLFSSAEETYSYGPADLVLRGVDIGPTPVAAIWIEDGVGGRFDLEDVDLAGGLGVTLGNGLVVHGNTIYARGTSPWDGTTGLRVADAQLHDAAGAAVLIDDGAGTVDATWTDNPTDVVRQRCTSGTDGTYIGAATVRLCPEQDELTLDLGYTTFLGDPVAEQ